MDDDATMTTKQPKLARTFDPLSSMLSAAELNKTDVVKNQVDIVVDLVRKYPRSTSRELSMRNPRLLDRHTVAKRMSIAEDRGLIKRMHKLRKDIFSHRYAERWIPVNGTERAQMKLFEK